MGFTEKVALDRNDRGRKPQYFREVGKTKVGGLEAGCEEKKESQYSWT